MKKKKKKKMKKKREKKEEEKEASMRPHYKINIYDFRHNRNKDVYINTSRKSQA